ncbi:hypothetical protein [Alloactinosynnema sp. L-07]|uniref:hypothetical protein n=1 Tax=Alloactinosynnema sp. L-07 TaxID=1653480 RepID=UPI00065F095D|nr:hypothetical protein [Alloactinosynnema sp. L-07]CRK56169.1 hypothetical protein [Alloactinosynnema sp. L-07]
MSDDAISGGGPEAGRPAAATPLRPRRLPTLPCSVVWSRGRAYVLEAVDGYAFWVGFDQYGRPQSLSRSALERQGWTPHRAERKTA